jgi:GNAT superfamily N-acetyltransferase
VEAESEAAFPDAFLVHVRAAHDWPFGDVAVQVVGEALLRLSRPAERLDSIGDVVVHPVMPDHLDAWAAFFDHDAFADRPWLAACYCLEQHAPMPPQAIGGWRDNRAAMMDRFRQGTAYGYLAVVDGRTAGWVNAAMRGDQMYALDRPDDATTITVSCFNIAGPYRGHRLSQALLDRVIADAPSRGATRVEAYPRAGKPEEPATFRGSLDLFTSRGFVVVKELPAASVVRLSLS